MLQNGIAMPDDRTRHVVAELHQLDLRRRQDAVLRGAGVVAPAPAPSAAAAEGAAAEGGARPANRDPGTRLMRRGVSSTGLHRAATRATTNAGADARCTPARSAGAASTMRAATTTTSPSDSEPARFGSSLGLAAAARRRQHAQRVPERALGEGRHPDPPGKEKAAINWLKGVEGMNGITDDVIYHASESQRRTSTASRSTGRS